MLRVTITINSRATLSSGFAFSGDAPGGAVTPGCGNQRAQGQRTVFILLKRRLLSALFFRKIQTFSQLRPASPALTETFQCSSLKNAVTECTCYGAGWLTCVSDGLQKSYYFKIVLQVWCKHRKESVRQRFTLSLTNLYSVIYKFSIHWYDPTIPGCQLMLAGLPDKSENKNHELLGVMMLYFTESLL